MLIDFHKKEIPRFHHDVHIRYYLQPYPLLSLGQVHKPIGSFANLFQEVEVDRHEQHSRRAAATGLVKPHISRSTVPAKVSVPERVKTRFGKKPLSM